MNLPFSLLLIVAVLALAAALYPIASRLWPRIEFANIAEGTVNGNKTYAADAAIASRFLLAKIGTDANHVDLAGTADIPIGVINDEAGAAEDLVNVQLLGSASSTLKVVASAPISAGAFIVSAASGKVRTLPASAGTYYIIGRALQAAGADGDVIEIDPIPVVQRVV